MAAGRGNWEEVKSRMAGLEDDPTIHFVGNRFSSIFEKAIEGTHLDDIDLECSIVLSYWDTYFGELPALPDWMEDARVLRVIEKTAINPLSNKKKMPKMLAEAGKSYVAPPTYESIEEAETHAGGEVSIWFFKSAYGTAGKNMFCVSTDDLSEAELPEHHVIQAGVQNLALIDGKKFTTRIYVLIWNGATYLYDNGFLMIHGTVYDETSTDYAVQIDHVGYANPDGPVKMQQLVHYDDYEKFAPKFTELIREIDPIFAEAKAASDRDSYILLGIDILLQASGDIKLIEINTFPNFLHTPEITDEVNIPFFIAAIKTMLDCEIDSLQKV
jgi:hypothetical protein